MLMASHRHLTLHEKNTATSTVAVNPCTHINSALHKVIRVQHLPASQTKDQNWYHFQSCTVLCIYINTKLMSVLQYNGSKYIMQMLLSNTLTNYSWYSLKNCKQRRIKLIGLLDPSSVTIPRLSALFCLSNAFKSSTLPEVQRNSQN